MAHSASTERQTHYAVPAPMPWPIMGAGALFLMAGYYFGWIKGRL